MMDSVRKRFIERCYAQEKTALDRLDEIEKEALVNIEKQREIIKGDYQELRESIRTKRR